MVAKIGILPARSCDRAAVGIIFELLRKEWPDEVFLIWWPVPSVYPSFDVPVLVLVANDWEMLYQMRTSIKQKTIIKENKAYDRCHICGLCLGEIPPSLAGLLHFTVYTDIEDLMVDLGRSLKKEGVRL